MNQDNIKNNRLINKSRDNKTVYFIMYTLIFFAFSLVVFSPFILDDISLIRRGDTFCQHYKALLYYSDWLQQIAKNLINNHSLIIPQFDFSVGLGSDSITTFTYYAIGDPFNFLSILCPDAYIDEYFNFAVILRFYFIGIAFSLLCIEFRQRNPIANLIGSFMYCFSSYALYAGVKHPFFLNPIIFLPCIIIGVERIIKGKSPLVLSLAVMLSVLNNFYFFYLLVLLTVIYVAVRLICLYMKQIKKAFEPFIKIAFGSALGVMMGAVLFLPTVLAFFADDRSATENAINLFYPALYYKNIPSALVSADYVDHWFVPGIAFLGIAAASVFFTQKKTDKVFLKWLLGFFAVFSVSPVFGTVFNGFSYSTNRWCFAISFVLSLMLVFSFNKIINPGKKELTALTGVFILLCVLNIITGKITGIRIITSLSLYLILLAVLWARYSGVKRIKSLRPVTVQLMCLVLVALSVFSNAIWLYGDFGDNYISEFYTNNEVDEHTSYASINGMKQQLDADGIKEEFCRFTGSGLDINASAVNGVNTTQFYWSLSNGNISRFRREMNLRENYTYCYEGFDDSTVLNGLSSVRYYYLKQGNKVFLPYGYTGTNAEGMYKTENYLPLGYTYDSIADYESYLRLDNSVDKRFAMLDCAVTEDGGALVKSREVTGESEEVDYKIKLPDTGISMTDNAFIVSEPKAKVIFTFDKQENSEVYLCLKNLDFKTDTDMAVTSVTCMVSGRDEHKNHSLKKLEYFTENHTFFCNRKNFDINLGYSESGIQMAVIYFYKTGTYSFEDIKIISHSMASYDEKIAALKQDVLENVNVSQNRIKGELSLDSDKLLCVTVPYSDGWTAYVNGEERELLCVNGMYMGIELEKGEYDIELKYNTPGFKLGAVVSVIGFTVFFALLLYNFISRKRSAYENNKKSDNQI